MAGNTVSIRISAQAAQAIAQLNATAAATERIGKAGLTTSARLQKTGATMTRVGGTLTRDLSLPLVVAGAASVKLAVDFDTSLNHIQALVGASSGQMDEYRKSILALAPAVGKGPKELADALYFITSSGFKGAAALRILTAGAKASAAGLGDTQTVVDLVTSAVNAYGAKSLSAAKATDVLTAAVRLGKAEPQALATAMGRVIPLAQAMGVSFGEASGAVAALTLSGLNADEAVTSIRSTLSSILKPGADAKKALAGVGLSAKALREEVSTKGLQAALIDLNTRFKGNTTEMGRVIPQARAMAGVLALIGPNAAKDAGIIRDVTAATGDTAKAFDKASKNEMFKFNQSLATLKVTGIQLGSALVPVLVDIAGGVKTVAEAFGGLSPEMQKVVLISAGVLAALGPVLTIGGNLVKAYALLRPILVGVAAAEAEVGAAGAVASGGSGMGGLLGLGASFGPWGLLVAGGIAVVGGEILAARGSTDLMTQAMDDAKRATQQLGDALAGLKSDTIAAKQAELDKKNAADDLATKTKHLTKLVHEGKKGTKEYTSAVREQTQAEITLQSAKARDEIATNNQIVDRKKIREANGLVEDSITKMGDAAKSTATSLDFNLNRALFTDRSESGKAASKAREAALAYGIWTKKTTDLATSSDGLSRKMHGTTSTFREAHRRAALLSLAALDVGKKIDGIPTKHQIDVYYRQNLAALKRQADELRNSINSIQDKTVSVTVKYFETGKIPGLNPLQLSSSGTTTTRHQGPPGFGPNVAHAAGGITIRPIQVGNDIYGEAGREAILPLQSASGRKALSDALLAAGAGAGGGGVVFGEGAFRGANFYGAPTDAAAKMWAKAIAPHAARLTARR